MLEYILAKATPLGRGSFIVHVISSFVVSVFLEAMATLHCVLCFCVFRSNSATTVWRHYSQVDATLESYRHQLTAQCQSAVFQTCLVGLLVHIFVLSKQLHQLFKLNLRLHFVASLVQSVFELEGNGDKPASRAAAQLT